MKLKTFKFLGETFKPIRQFSLNEGNIFEITPYLKGLKNNEKFTNYDGGKWSWQEFYNKAKKAGAGEIDVFEMKGKNVVPCKNELFELTY